jgi:cytochrome c oxidase assembly protein subunit 15
MGRVIGLVWALGFFGFLIARKIPTGWTPRLLGLGLLGGLQGAIGWWMVSSGLEAGQLDVKPYRLATHLGLAFAILGLIAWYVLALSRSEAALMQTRRTREARLYSLATLLAGLAFLQILMGALVAGLDAGRNYHDWPLMAGAFLPPGPFDITPLWRNFFENDGLVQFIHRMTGYLTFAIGLYIWWRARRSPNAATRFAFNAMLSMLTLQMLIGIFTVLYMAQAHIAITHQIGAILLWVLILNARFNAGFPTQTAIKRT